jgi:hypothetical protein
MKVPIPPPPALTIVNSETPDSTIPTPTEPSPLPSDLVRPSSSKDKEFTATVDSDGDWFLVISDKGTLRHLTETEARQVASVMNEQGSNIITLYCRTETCRHKNTWIKRSSDDVKKNVYFCDGCKQGMTR